MGPTTSPDSPAGAAWKAYLVPATDEGCAMDFLSVTYEINRLQRLLAGYCWTRDYTEAVAVGRELLELTVGFGDPYQGVTASDTAWALRYLGDAFAGLGDATAAESAYRK